MSRHRRRILLRRTRIILVLFTACLALSGLTAIPVEWELDVLARLLGLPPDADAANHTGLAHWIAKVRAGVRDTNARYPFIAYGFDWLAFAHVVLGILFVGAIIDPVRNLWVITFGMIACALVMPWALVFGHVRGIPFSWQLIDGAFGLVGIIPLWLARRFAVQLAALGD